MAHPGITFLDENTPHAVQSAHGGRVRRSTRCCRNFNGFGILGCLFSILGIFTFGLASPIGLGISLLGMTRCPRGAATIGTLLGGAGTAFLALWGWGVLATMNAVEYSQRADQTQVVLQHGVRSIEQFHREHGELPEGIQGNKLLIAGKLNDAWGQSLRYDPIDDDAYLVRSAGPDEEFDTADDLTAQ